MRVQVVGEGVALLHECEEYSEAERWLGEYVEDGDAGGWEYIQILVDGAVRFEFSATYDQD